MCPLCVAVCCSGEGLTAVNVDVENDGQAMQQLAQQMREAHAAGEKVSCYIAAYWCVCMHVALEVPLKCSGESTVQARSPVLVCFHPYHPSSHVIYHLLHS